MFVNVFSNFNIIAPHHHYTASKSAARLAAMQIIAYLSWENSKTLKTF